MERRDIASLSIVMALVVMLALPALADHVQHPTQLISSSTIGDLGNNMSRSPALSADGKTLVYSSWASNLVQADTNGRADVFLYDVVTRSTTLISRNDAGFSGNGDSLYPAISDDGALVVYESTALDLVVGQTPSSGIYLYDVSTNTTELISVDSAGVPGNGASEAPAISADGSTIVYSSSASNLVPGDTNNDADIFRYDRLTGETTLISWDMDGGPSTGDSTDPDISGDGTTIVFESLAYDLVADDAEPGSYYAKDIFVHDAMTGVTTLITRNDAGMPADNNSYGPSVSGDGTKVVYVSAASGLVVNPTPAAHDVFLFDRLSGETRLVSMTAAETGGNGHSGSPIISSNGEKVAFTSDASDLVVGDVNSIRDAFVRDVATGETTLISTNTSGVPANSYSFMSTVSGDGRVLAFVSSATDVVADDTNGQDDVFLWATDAAPTGDPVSGTLRETISVGTVAVTVVAVDGNGDPLTFAITAGNELGLFSVGRTSGVLATAASIQGFEGTHELTVTVSDGTHDVPIPIMITVLPNVAPTIPNVSVAVSEDLQVGASVATVAGADADGDSLAYSLTGGNGSDLFTIDAALGVVSLAGALDFEVASSHVLTVNVSDGSLSAEAILTVDVTDVGGPLDVVVADGADTFDDDDDSIFEADIEWLAAAGITSGCGERLFCPTSNVTRGQMAAFLARALRLPATDVDFFTDDDGTLFENDINRLAASGITSGCSDTSYCADANVTRGQMAAFLARALRLPAADVDFFADDDGTLFENDINRLAASGITSGCSDTSYCADSFVTRGQMAAFLHRALK